MKLTIAENMKNILLSQQRSCVWYGDLSIIEECAKQSNNISNHPKRKIQNILNALDHSNLFEKKYIMSDISGQNRKYRCFCLK